MWLVLRDEPEIDWPIGTMSNFGEKFSFSQEFRLGNIVRYNINQELFLVLCETGEAIAEDNWIGDSPARLAQDFSDIVLGNCLDKTEGLCVDVTETLFGCPFSWECRLRRPIPNRPELVILEERTNLAAGEKRNLETLS
jgi:hypothetical protein